MQRAAAALVCSGTGEESIQDLQQQEIGPNVQRRLMMDCMHHITLQLPKSCSGDGKIDELDTVRENSYAACHFFFCHFLSHFDAAPLSPSQLEKTYLSIMAFQSSSTRLTKTEPNVNCGRLCTGSDHRTGKSHWSASSCRTRDLWQGPC